MTDFLLHSATHSIMLRTTVLVIVSIVGFYIVQRFRDVADDGDTTDDMLANFREMEHRGDLSAKEFRTIKTVMAARMQSRTNSEGRSE